ncbi:TPA: hypothetical protein KQB05_003936, partial [Clostridioides difficile]|nr:hypothetical protein [Clostridioides difficile]
MMKDIEFKGFRLTIWNVNKEGGEQYAWVKWRFRLTIWNVNVLIKPKQVTT